MINTCLKRLKLICLPISLFPKIVHNSYSLNCLEKLRKSDHVFRSSRMCCCFFILAARLCQVFDCSEDVLQACPTCMAYLCLQHFATDVSFYDPTAKPGKLIIISTRVSMTGSFKISSQFMHRVKKKATYLHNNAFLYGYHRISIPKTSTSSECRRWHAY